MGDAFSYFVMMTAIGLAPGPVVLLLIARAASNDVGGAVVFALGTVLGSLVILAATCFGLAGWLATTPEVLSYSKYLMLAYVIWIAAGIWRRGVTPDVSTGAPASGCGASAGAGFMTSVLSPYILVLFPLVLPEVLNVSRIALADFLIVSVLTFTAKALVALLIIGFALRIRILARSRRAALIFNRGLASLLAVGGGWLALT